MTCSPGVFVAIRHPQSVWVLPAACSILHVGTGNLPQMPACSWPSLLKAPLECIPPLPHPQQIKAEFFGLASLGSHHHPGLLPVSPADLLHCPLTATPHYLQKCPCQPRARFTHSGSGPPHILCLEYPLDTGPMSLVMNLCPTRTVQLAAHSALRGAPGAAVPG